MPAPPRGRLGLEPLEAREVPAITLGFGSNPGSADAIRTTLAAIGNPPAPRVAPAVEANPYLVVASRPALNVAATRPLNLTPPAGPQFREPVGLNPPLAVTAGPYVG